MPENSWLIAGLGNPGPEYAATRHNAGFRVVDLVAEEVRATYWKSECGSLVAHREWEGLQLAIAKPQSFMNLSGIPIAQLMRKYEIPPERLIVVHDELDIPPGTIRVKFAGGHGGHNGLRSIIERCGSRDFFRVRIGIGRPPGQMPTADYVLSVPRGDAAEEFDHAIALGAEAVPYLIQNGLVKTQDRFN